MKKIQIEKNEWKEMIEIESATRIINDGCHFKTLSDTIIHIGQKMQDRKATPKHVDEMLDIRDSLDLIVDQFKCDVSNWASSFSIGEEDIKEDK